LPHSVFTLVWPLKSLKQSLPHYCFGDVQALWSWLVPARPGPRTRSGRPQDSSLSPTSQHQTCI